MSTLAMTDRAVRGSQQIRKDEVKPQGPTLAPKYTDDAAVKLTIQDAGRGKTTLDQRQFNLHLREADVLFQSPRTNSNFEGSTVSRANISRFTVAKHTNSLVPTMKAGIFYETPPFVIRPRPGADQNTARAKSALYGALMDSCDFEGTSEEALEYMTVFGTVIVKAGWETVTKKRKIRKPKAKPLEANLPYTGKIRIRTVESDQFKTTEEDVTTEGMWFELCQLGQVLIDPAWNHPNKLHKCKWLIHVSYPTMNDLDEMRQQIDYDEDGNEYEIYDIPSEQELLDYFYSKPFSAGIASQVEQNLGDQNWTISHAQNPEKISTEALDERPIKMLERWDQTYVYTVLAIDGGEEGILIRKEMHSLPFIPTFSANFWNIPNSPYGLGVGRMSGNDQRVDKGLTDAALDILSFALNPQYVRDRGANIATQQIRTRLGGIIDADAGPRGLREAFALVETPRIPAETFTVLMDSRNAAEGTVGADEAFQQGNLPSRGKSSAARTATGAGAIASASAEKIGGPVGHFVRGILIPFVLLMDYFSKQRMSPSYRDKILGKKLGAEFLLDADDFYESEDEFECLAGAKLAAKKAMAQALPFLIQIFENMPIVQQLNATGYVVDVQEIVNMVMEVSEWKNKKNLIRRMTRQEAARFQQSNPGMQKTQSQLATVAARHQAKSEEIDQKENAALAREMLGRASDEALQWDERRWDRQYDNESVYAPEGA
jgi:hypothetical protein